MKDANRHDVPIRVIISVPRLGKNVQQRYDEKNNFYQGPRALTRKYYHCVMATFHIRNVRTKVMIRIALRAQVRKIVLSAKTLRAA